MYLEVTDSFQGNRAAKTFIIPRQYNLDSFKDISQISEFQIHLKMSINVCLFKLVKIHRHAEFFIYIGNQTCSLDLLL